MFDYTDESEPTPQESQQKHLLWVVVALLVCGLGLGLAYVNSSKWSLGDAPNFSVSSLTSQDGHANASKTLFYLSPMIMNTTDVGATSFMRLTLALDLERPEVADQVQARLPAIQSAVIVAAASRNSQILKSAGGKAMLRDEITKNINELLPNGGVRTVYFSDFLIR